MLVINTNSWHYRVYTWWKENLSRKPPATINLCHYMRVILLYVPGFFLFLGLACLIGGAILLVAGIVLAPIWIPAYFILRNKDWLNRFGEWLEPKVPYIGMFLVGATLLTLTIVYSLDVWWHGLAFIGGLVGVLGLIALVAIGAAELHDRRHFKRQRIEWGLEAPKPPGTPSLFWQWVKAKKKKICPIIQTQGGEVSAE